MSEPPEVINMWLDEQINDRIVLKFFALKDNPNMITIYENLKNIIEEKLGKKIEFKFVDLFENWQEAKDFNILITPTLVKVKEKVITRLSGNLSKIDEVIKYLDLENNKPNEGQKSIFLKGSMK